MQIDRQGQSVKLKINSQTNTFISTARAYINQDNFIQQQNSSTIGLDDSGTVQDSVSSLDDGESLLCILYNYMYSKGFNNDAFMLHSLQHTWLKYAKFAAYAVQYLLNVQIKTIVKLERIQ